jgi:hypothetical protein
MIQIDTIFTNNLDTNSWKNLPLGQVQIGMFSPDMWFQVAFLPESQTTRFADKRFLPSVFPHVDN